MKLLGIYKDIGNCRKTFSVVLYTSAVLCLAMIAGFGLGYVLLLSFIQSLIFYRISEQGNNLLLVESILLFIPTMAMYALLCIGYVHIIWLGHNGPRLLISTFCPCFLVLTITAVLFGVGLTNLSFSNLHKTAWVIIKSIYYLNQLC